MRKARLACTCCGRQYCLIQEFIVQPVLSRGYPVSSVTIVVLVLAGIIALMFIGYLNNLLEKNKIDKARRKAELIEIGRASCRERV